MKNRIKKIIEYENISYSEFADKVRIQRSGVSHLISGRNNPGLEVIQKILKAFDYINTDWLLLGKGNMIKDEKKEIQRNLFSEIPENEEDNIIAPENEAKTSSETDKMEDNTAREKILNSQEDKNSDKKTIERIIIFYSDKSFSEYKPE